MGGSLGCTAASNSNEYLETEEFNFQKVDPNSIFGRLGNWAKNAKISVAVDGYSMEVDLEADIALQACVDMFYDKVLLDPLLKDFFQQANMKILRKHQFDFLKSALSNGTYEYKHSKNPIVSGHSRLFLKGLNETHFDLVAGHLVATLHDLKVDEEIITDIVHAVVPLRDLFITEANRAKEKTSLHIIKSSEE